MRTVHKAALTAAGLLATLCVPATAQAEQATAASGHPSALARY
jgi:hypothetical protein